VEFSSGVVYRFEFSAAASPTLHGSVLATISQAQPLRATYYPGTKLGRNAHQQRKRLLDSNVPPDWFHFAAQGADTDPKLTRICSG
jgi:hypothetical protein